MLKRISVFSFCLSSIVVRSPCFFTYTVKIYTFTSAMLLFTFFVHLCDTFVPLLGWTKCAKWAKGSLKEKRMGKTVEWFVLSLSLRKSKIEKAFRETVKGINLTARNVE